MRPIPNISPPHQLFFMWSRRFRLRPPVHFTPAPRQIGRAILILGIVALMTIYVLYGRESHAPSAPVPAQASFIPPTFGEGEILGQNVNIRRGPGRGFSVITTLHAPLRVRVMSFVEGWYHVKSSDGEGFVFGAYLKPLNFTCSYELGMVNEPYLIVMDENNTAIVLPRGAKLLLKKDTRCLTCGYEVILPDGRRGTVDPDDVSLLTSSTKR